MEKTDIHKIVERIIERQEHDVNMASPAYREDLTNHIADSVNSHVNQMLESILIPHNDYVDMNTSSSK